MSYELRIERRRSEGVEEIDEPDWLDFVRSSPDFVLRDELRATEPSTPSIAMVGPFACWTGHPSVDLVPLRWSNGTVTLSFGDEHAVTAALLVAEAFDATVVGDDGEVYDAPIGGGDLSPAWEFPEHPEPSPDPVAIDAPTFGGPPPKEEVVVDFDGDETLWDRMLPWRRRQRGT